MATVAHERPRPAQLDPQLDELVEESRARVGRRLGGRDRLASIVVGGAFLAAALPLALLAPSDRSPSLLLVAGLLGAFAVASRIEFEIGAGSAIPTQLVFVPLLFLLPLGTVPLVVALGMLLGGLGGLVRGRAHPARVPVLLASSWHAVGPVAVLLLAGERGPAFSDWPIYVAAFGAQFAFDFLSAAARDRLALGVSVRNQLRFLGWVYLVDTALAPIGFLGALAAERHGFAFTLALPLAALLAHFARERQVRIDHALELGQAYRGTAFLLGDVIEADDAYTGSHSRDVVSLVLGACDQLKVSPQERRDAEFAALLHDVGKIRIAPAIINKPGPLSADEWEIMRTHTIEGQLLLDRVGGVLGQIGHIVRSCHEHFDGAGYPDGLIAEEIPLVARIVACCDAYSAMTTDRSYRRALSEDAANAELVANSGSQFDPLVVDALLAFIRAS